MTEKKTENFETEQKFTGINTPIMIANGFGLSTMSDLTAITFLFSPPEGQSDNTVSVLFRVGLLPEPLEELSKRLNELLEELRKDGKLEPEVKIKA